MSETKVRPESLQDLIARCALADQRALRELYRQTRSRLYAVALRMLRQTDLAEDALQESFVKVWRSAGSYRPDLAAPMTWLSSIVRNQCLDMLRRTAGERAMRDYPQEDEDVFEKVEYDGPDPLSQAIGAQEGAALARCMGGLREAQQRLISRAFYEGLSHTELSEATGMPLGTVKTSIRRGLAALRECLEGAGN